MTSIANIPSNIAPYANLPPIIARLFEAKARLGVTFEKIAKDIGKDEVWVAALFYGQAKGSAEDLAQISQTLGVPQDDLIAELGDHWFPNRGIGPIPPTDPVIYRLFECVLVYGHALKAIIHEKFGDGIMSMIDCKLHVEKKADPKGDRVVLTIDIDSSQWKVLALREVKYLVALLVSSSPNWPIHFGRPRSDDGCHLKLSTVANSNPHRTMVPTLRTLHILTHFVDVQALSKKAVFFVPAMEMSNIASTDCRLEQIPDIYPSWLSTQSLQNLYPPPPQTLLSNYGSYHAHPFSPQGIHTPSSTVPIQSAKLDSPCEGVWGPAAVEFNPQFLHPYFAAQNAISDFSTAQQPIIDPALLSDTINVSEKENVGPKKLSPAEHSIDIDKHRVEERVSDYATLTFQPALGLPLIPSSSFVPATSLLPLPPISNALQNPPPAKWLSSDGESPDSALAPSTFNNNTDVRWKRARESLSPRPTPPKRRAPNMERTCTFCGFTASSPSSLQKHWYKHGPRRFFCTAPECPKTYKQPFALQRHLNHSPSCAEGCGVPRNEWNHRMSRFDMFDSTFILAARPPY
ncbi:hypothetical protein EW146_g6389 [Bondarzewia mesenterica]|uniref:Cyanate hydratase n=1 Tax=Bondarzewia mesenterica TaxID=1095465 RepID=A0A4S4LNM3_9AGAM|nr:hypothetical protein EW146_g6389 [Bondarzewia mesenterica]